MRKDKAPLVAMALVMVGLGLALVLLFRSSMPPVPQSTATPVQVPSQAPPTEVAVLLVGVDSLSYSHPTLETLAVVKYTIGVGVYTLISASPDTLVNPDSPDPAQRTLGGVYGFDAPNNAGAVITKYALWHIMGGIGGLDPEVDFDRGKLTETIGELGNFEFRGEKLDGAALQNLFDALPPSAQEKRLQFQEDVLRCLFLAAKRKTWDLPHLMGALGGRFYPGVQTTLAELKTAPPLADADFTVTAVPLTPPIMPTP